MERLRRVGFLDPRAGSTYPRDHEKVAPGQGASAGDGLPFPGTHLVNSLS